MEHVEQTTATVHLTDIPIEEAVDGIGRSARSAGAVATEEEGAA